MAVLLKEMYTEEATILEEGEGASKKMYIEGISIQMDIGNKNKRIYPKEHVQQEIQRYINEVVLGKSGWSESLYSAVKNPTTKKLELINVQLNGSGLTHWKDFVKSNDIWSNAIHVKEFTNEKKGVNKYFAPKFTCVKIKKETDIEAAVLQKEIIAFLTAYYAKNKAELGGQATTTTAPTATNKSQEAAFNNDKHPQAQHSEVIEEGNDIVRGMEMPEGEDF